MLLLYLRDLIKKMLGIFHLEMKIYVFALLIMITVAIALPIKDMYNSMYIHTIIHTTYYYNPLLDKLNITSQLILNINIMPNERKLFKNYKLNEIRAHMCIVH